MYMETRGGIEKPKIIQLPHIEDRITFIYLEKCRISRDDGAITAQDKNGITFIPAAIISALMLGPGTEITHRAMELIGDAGVAVIWVGEHGVRYYASGKALTNHSSMLVKQAELVSNEKKHIQVARKMYQLRFPDEDVSKLTMQQLRGREGSRIRTFYREMSKKYGVEWKGREYKPGKFEESNLVNQSLSAGNACLYGVAYAVISAMGCSPGLGFVHVGHELSFVYDIADLYKTEVTIPIAFELAADNAENIGSATRRKVRDTLKSGKILNKMVKDIKYLLSDSEQKEDYASALYLWDNLQGDQEHGISYMETGNK